MKIKFLSLISIFILVLIGMTSCLKDNDVIEYPADATIYSFAINDIKTTIIKEGDTIQFTVNGKDYPFNVNQKEGLIFNRDSLPYNTDVSKVSLNILTAGGPVYYQKNGKDTLWTSADSLNFTNTSSTSPILFKVFSPDLQNERNYKVWMNVYKQNPDSLLWTQLKSAGFPGSLITGKQKAVVLKDRIYVFAEVGAQVKVTSTAVNDGVNWTTLTELAGVTGDVNCSSAVVFDNKLFIVAGERVCISEDGRNWTQATSPAVRTFVTSFTNNPVSTRLYSQDKRLIGINGTRFIQTSDGVNWMEMGEIPTDFPTSGFAASSAYVTNSNSDIERSVLIGNVEKIDTAAVSWTILSNEREYVRLSPFEEGLFNCPKLENLSLIHYGDRLYAFGGKGLYDGSIKPFQSFYSSVDNGISWMRVNRYVTFPVDFLGRNDQFSYVVDNDHFFWIMWSGSGEVWKGKINRLGFEK